MMKCQMNRDICPICQAMAIAEKWI